MTVRQSLQAAHAFVSQSEIAHEHIFFDEMSRDFRKKFRKIKENQDLYRGKYYKMKAKNRGENMILEIEEASKNKGYEFPRTHFLVKERN